MASNANLSATKTFYAEKRDGLYIDGAATVNFTLARATVSLSGTVKNSSGNGISGATVKVLDGVNKDKTATTNSSGDYRFDALEAGDMNFEASASGYHAGYRGLSVDGVNTLNFTLNARDAAPALSIAATLIIGGPGSVPQEWAFTASLTGSATISYYDWEFGDGNSATNSTATEQHVYRTRGTYTVRVVGVRTNGSTLEASYELTVE